MDFYAFKNYFQLAVLAVYANWIRSGCQRSSFYLLDRSLYLFIHLFRDTILYKKIVFFMKAVLYNCFVFPDLKCVLDFTGNLVLFCLFCSNCQNLCTVT